MTRRHGIGIALVIGLASITVGCQRTATIEWDSPGPVACETRTPLYVGELCQSKRQGAIWGSKAHGQEIGKHTFTVFAIPAGELHADPETPVQASFDRAIRESLTAAGYDLRPASDAPDGATIMTGELRECFFWSYSWFWPIFIQGGKTRVALRLARRGHKPVWAEEFSAYSPGVGFVGSFGFDGMVRSAMTRMLEDVTESCSKPEVVAKVRKANGRTARVLRGR
jgi:hypothetical protein